MKKTIIVLLVVAAIAVFFGMGLDQHLTLDAFRGSQAKFAAMQARSPWLTALREPLNCLVHKIDRE